MAVGMAMGSGLSGIGESWREQMQSLSQQEALRRMGAAQQNVPPGYRSQSFSEMVRESADREHYEMLRNQMQQINFGPHSIPVIPAPQPKGAKTSMGTNYIKEYFMKHREMLMGFTIFILLDHFVFEGAFRDKIKRIVHSLLDKAESKLTSLDHTPTGSTGSGKAA